MIGGDLFEAALRNEGFSMGFDPLPENPRHGEVWGFSRSRKCRLQELGAACPDRRRIADTDLN
jgi:hypothetical protein